MCPSRYRRTDRVAALILREVTRIVRQEVHDPRIGFVTFTGAEVTPDLSSGRLFVSVLGTEAEKAESLSGLRSAASFIRNRLWDLLDLKTVPELAFELDRTLERAARIDAILERIQEEGAASGRDDSVGATEARTTDARSSGQGEGREPD
jgi:ribosome-binding factor A